MPDAVKKNWIIYPVIAVMVIAAGIVLFFHFYTKDQIYLKIDGVGYPLKGAHVISNNLKIGEVAQELTKVGSQGQLFRIRFDQTVHIPVNSEINIRQSALDSSYTVFLRLVPSKNYYAKGDTILISVDQPDPAIETKGAFAPDTLQMLTESEMNDRKPETEMVMATVKELTPEDEMIFFMVQLIASRVAVGEKSAAFKGIDSIDMIREDGLYKYFTGKTESLKQASLTKERMVSAGFADAFIVAYKGQHRISVKDAVSLKK
jgi:hypothetical protein